MATDRVAVWNRALSLLGVKSNISSPTEQSRAAEVCRLWYDTVLDQVLRAAPWPSARGYQRLALLAEREPSGGFSIQDIPGETGSGNIGLLTSTSADPWVPADPAPGWRFAYSVPSDMIHPGWISTYDRFEIGYVEGNKAVMTNENEAILVYTRREEVTTRWDIGLEMAITHALAANMAMELTGKLNRVQLEIQQANRMVVEARAAVLNGMENQFETYPDWITARGFAPLISAPKFIFPFGPLVAAAGASVE